jgi:hypothetical protein
MTSLDFSERVAETLQALVTPAAFEGIVTQLEENNREATYNNFNRSTSKNKPGEI